jgi:hypothetical protein
VQKDAIFQQRVTYEKEDHFSKCQDLNYRRGSQQTLVDIEATDL